jgi:hypothetical protein
VTVSGPGRHCAKQERSSHGCKCAHQLLAHFPDLSCQSSGVSVCRASFGPVTGLAGAPF